MSNTPSLRWTELHKEESFGVPFEDIHSKAWYKPNLDIKTENGISGHTGFIEPGNCISGYTGFINMSDYEEIITGYRTDGTPIISLRKIERYDNISARHEQQLKELKTKNELAAKLLQYQNDVDRILKADTLAPSTKDKIGQGIIVRFAHYMTRDDKVKAAGAIHRQFGNDWPYKALFVLKSEQYRITDWHVNDIYACTLFNDNTIIIYKKPIPNVPKQKADPIPEPVPLWDERDLVQSGLNWK